MGRRRGERCGLGRNRTKGHSSRRARHGGVPGGDTRAARGDHRHAGDARAPDDRGDDRGQTQGSSDGPGRDGKRGGHLAKRGSRNRIVAAQTGRVHRGHVAVPVAVLAAFDAVTEPFHRAGARVPREQQERVARAPTRARVAGADPPPQRKLRRSLCQQQRLVPEPVVQRREHAHAR